MKNLVISIVIMLCSSNLNSAWKSIDGPYNSNIRCLCASENKIFAGTNDGILISTNSGNSYSKPENELIGKQVLSIQVLSNKNIIAATAYDGIFVSDDNGVIWNPKNEGLEGESLTGFDIYIDEAKIYIATKSGIYLSDDNAESWRDISGNMPMRMTTNIAATGNTILAGASLGLHISRNGGESWEKIEQMAEYNVVETITIHNNIIYAVVRIGGFADLSGLFVSKNYGETWLDISTGLLGSLRDIFVSDDYIFVASNRGLQISEHEIVKWKNISRDTIDGNIVYTIENLDLSSVIVHNERIIIGSNGGIFSSDDAGKTWELNLPVLSGKEVYSIEMQGNSIYVGTESGLYLSDDFGTTWKNLTKAIGNQTVRAIIFSGNDIIIGASFGVYYSSNNGISWENKDFGIDKSVAVFSLLKMDNNIFAGTYYDGIFLSSDSGNSWVQMNSGISDPRVIQLNNIGNTIFAGIVDTHPGLYSTNDFGANWTECSLVEDWSYMPWVYSIAILDNSLFIGTGWNGIYKSDDLGKTWQEKNNGPDNMRNFDVFSIASNENLLIATSKSKNETHNKLLLSTDSGENWAYCNMEGIQNLMIRKVFVRDNYVFAGARRNFSSKTGGFYIANLNDLINSTSIFDNFTDIKPFSIYPNPAGDFITIQFSNKELQPFAESVKVQIFDVLGIEVMTTLIHPMTPSHRMNIEHLPHGVYFIRIGNNFEKFVKNEK
jgi:photosystem II stability/assembly factor-like uncharacterized protein